MAWRRFAVAYLLMMLVADTAAAAPCTSSWDCLDANEPFCAAQVCAPGPACPGDDPADQGGGDDGPAAAAALALPARVTRSICGLSGERDWFAFDLATSQVLAIHVDWNASLYFGVTLLDAQGTPVESLKFHKLEPPGMYASESHATYRADLAPGHYYVVVGMSGAPTPTSVFSYDLAIHALECRMSPDCTDPARPMCSPALECVAGPAECTGDDPRDAGGGDDGPAAAKLLADGEIATGAVCNTPGDSYRRWTTVKLDRPGFVHWDHDEADWYAIDVATPGEGLIVRVAFAQGDDLDLVMFDEHGEFLGRSNFANPERVTLTYLPVGRYYARVTRWTQYVPSPQAVPYSISVERTPAQSCASAKDCAAEYETQYFRGACEAGVCKFIGVAGTGQPCDFSHRGWKGCAYRDFQANAHKNRVGADCRPNTCAPDEYCKNYSPPGLPGCGPQGCPESLGSCALKCTCDGECGLDLLMVPTDGSAWVYARCREDGVCVAGPGDLATCVVEEPEPEPEPTEPPSGCGCRSGAAGAAGSAPLLLALLALRRRRPRR